MTLKDVKSINRTNRKAVLIGVVLVFVGSVLGAYLASYGWLLIGLLGALPGVIGVLVSLRHQQTQLLKLFEEKLNAKSVSKVEIKPKVIRKSNAPQEKEIV